MKSKDELIQIMRLAKLAPDLEDIDMMVNDMSVLLSDVELIKDVDLSDANLSVSDTCADTDETVSRLREDVVEPSVPVDVLLADALQKQDNFIVV